jgi:GntR family transcriptional regulator / MocR family aminotransferase
MRSSLGVDWSLGKVQSVDGIEVHLPDLQLRIDRTTGGLAAQVAAELRTAVRSGRLAGGVRLPASRELARDLGTSRGVVVEAYEQLVAEGFLVSRQGSGTRVADLQLASAADAAAPAAALPPRVAYDLRVGTPDLTAFPRRAWLAAMRQVLKAVPHQALGYGDPGGVPELRAELAAYLRRVRAADVAADRLVVTNGVAQGLHLVIGALAKAGGPVPLAVEDPHSVRTLALLEAAGAVRVPVPVDGEGIVVDELRRTPARAVMVTPAHQYPTGVVLSPRRRAELVAWAAEVDGVVLEDDYDAEFRYDRDPVGCLQALCPQRVVLLGSVSKALAPGLRLGWLVAPPALAQAVRAARSTSDLGSPVLDQHALAELLASGAYDRQLRQLRRRYRSRRDALTGALARWLPAAVVHGVAAGIQLYVELPPGHDEAAVVEAAAERGVAVEGVAPLRIAGGGPPALVLGFARLPEHRIAEAVRLLADAARRARQRPARRSTTGAKASMSPSATTR